MLLIGNGQLITRDREFPYLKDGAVVIDGEVIKAVGSFADMKAAYPDAEFVDAKGGIIMPGLINAHTHIYSGLARGLAIAGNNPTNFFLEVTLDTSASTYEAYNGNTVAINLGDTIYGGYVTKDNNGVKLVVTHNIVKFNELTWDSGDWGSYPQFYTTLNGAKSNTVTSNLGGLVCEIYSEMNGTRPSRSPTRSITTRSLSTTATASHSLPICTLLRTQTVSSLRSPCADRSVQSRNSAAVFTHRRLQSVDS